MELEMVGGGGGGGGGAGISRGLMWACFPVWYPNGLVFSQFWYPYGPKFFAWSAHPYPFPEENSPPPHPQAINAQKLKSIWYVHTHDEATHALTKIP